MLEIMMEDLGDISFETQDSRLLFEKKEGNTGRKSGKSHGLEFI